MVFGVLGANFDRRDTLPNEMMHTDNQLYVKFLLATNKSKSTAGGLVVSDAWEQG